jgi:hypothetical protein
MQTRVQNQAGQEVRKCKQPGKARRAGNCGVQASGSSTMQVEHNYSRETKKGQEPGRAASYERQVDQDKEPCKDRHYRPGKDHERGRSGKLKIAGRPG